MPDIYLTKTIIIIIINLKLVLTLLFLSNEKHWAVMANRFIM